MSNKAGMLMHKTLVYTLLTMVTVVVLVPFIWMVTTSLKHQTKVFDFPPQWIPNPPVWQNYIDVFYSQPMFPVYYWNSVYIAVLVTLGTCLFASLAGYAFAKIYFPMRNVIFLILLSSMMIPHEVTVIPLFLWFSTLGIVDSHIPLIVPEILGAGGMFGVFLLRQFFITVPRDLDEAAEMDGCTPWRTFWTIMMPMAKPALATLAIFTFLHSWEDFFTPLVFLSSSKLFTLPIGMKLFTDMAGTEWHLLMAASVMATVPLLLVFFAAQKRFIEGVAMTGIK